jgi:hypothetical protein
MKLEVNETFENLMVHLAEAQDTLYKKANELESFLDKDMEEWFSTLTEEFQMGLVDPINHYGLNKPYLKLWKDISFEYRFKYYKQYRQKVLPSVEYLEKVLEEAKLSRGSFN